MQGQQGNMQGQQGNMQGQQGNMQGNSQGGQPKTKSDPAICEKMSKTIRPLAEGCLKLKEQAKRAQCFDKIGSTMEKTAPNGSCDQQLEPVKQEFMSKEKQMYPDQESALK